MYPIRFRGTDSAYIEQLIVTESPVGTGECGDTARIVRQYWTVDGELVAVYDPVFESLVRPGQYSELIDELGRLANRFGYSLQQKQP